MVPPLRTDLSQKALLEALTGMGTSRASFHCRGEVQPLSKIIFVLFMSLEFSVLAKMCLASEKAVIICGCGQYVAI